MERQIYDKLLDWKGKDDFKPLLILGARQVGKTYTVRQFCAKEYSKSVEVNLFDYPSITDLYQSNLSAHEKFEQLKLIINTNLDDSDFQRDGILFLDEIQESEELISALKFFRERKSGLRIICSGSLLGVRLKRLSKAFPVGQVDMLRLFPLSFEEFLVNTGNRMLRDAIADSFAKNQALSVPVHEKAINCYRSFLCIGGMPEVVNSYLAAGRDLAAVDRQTVKSILTAYFDDMNKYVNNYSESNRIESLYQSIPAQMLNASKKFQYSKLDSRARSRSHATALDWLVAADMVLPCTAVSGVDVPLQANINASAFKLYLNDIGFLVSLTNLDFADIMTNQSFSFKGALAENYVACELASGGKALFYWRSENKAEVDFLLENSLAQGGIIPAEVKADKHVQAPSLSVYERKFKPNHSIRISMKNFGMNDKIRSVPLYAVFCLCA